MPNKSFTAIDLNRLEEEWAGQPDRARKYHELLADAQKELDDTEDELEYLRAKLDQKIRSEPDKYGIMKVSEKAIESVIILEPAYRKVKRELNEKRHNVAILKAATIGLEHRKKGLENEVNLFGQKYFTIPYVNRETKIDMEEANRSNIFDRRKRKVTND